MRLSRYQDALAKTGLLVCTGVVLIPLFLVVAVMMAKGASVIDWTFLSENPADGMRAGGIFPAIVGTILLVLLTVAISLPVGVLAAIYLREYAGDSRLSRGVRLAILNLAGVPSIVHGLFGFALFVILLDWGASLLAGACTLAILILPVIITASEEALRAVPDGIRAASYALGATRWQTVWRAVLPNAVPGILTGTILGVGRAAGETAPVLFTVAAYLLPDIPTTVYDQAMLLPYHLYVIATQVTRVPEALPYAVALVLLAVVLGLNLVAILVRAWFRRRLLR